jgi:AraC-like DNA-binding protein
VVVKAILKNIGLHYIVVDLGEVEVMEDLSDELHSTLRVALQEVGLELMDDKRAILIEKIKNVIVEMIHTSDEVPKVNYSEYLSEKLAYAYTYLSNIFSEVKGITIQQFIITHKIERIKELIIYNELSISEIAWKMHYSSVAHLSNQFKKITGLTPSHFKRLKEKRSKSIQAIGDSELLIFDQKEYKWCKLKNKNYST